jgi:hypothetical protein
VPPHPSVAVHVIVVVPTPNVEPAKLEGDDGVNGPDEVYVSTGPTIIQPASAVSVGSGINPALFKYVVPLVKQIV